MIEFFLHRRVLTNLITIFIIAVGGYYAVNVRREAFPEINFDIVTITTMYPGGSPEEVETLVTRNVERELRSVVGIEKVESYSIENRSLIGIHIDENLKAREVSRVITNIYQAVQRVKDLPPEAEKPLVEELTSSAHPLITLSVTGGTDESRDRWADELKDIIEEIPGVARVKEEGDRERQIWVEADPEKLKGYGVTLEELANAIRTRNVDASAGSVEMGQYERFIRVTGEVQTAGEIGQFIIRGNDERSYIRVKDVAGVKETFEEARVLTRANGMPSINLLATKTSSGDAIEMTDTIRNIKAEHEARAAKENIQLILSDDLSFFIKRRLHVMTNNLIQGGILILAALFLFLDWRLATVAAWGVPISFAAAMMIAAPLGFTINLLSLLGFIIVLGMLDDDSVVVAENIYRHLEMGKPPEKAAIDGTREVILPVLGSVMLSTCAFLPFALMSGIMGKFMFMIPVIVCMCFLASVFEAFFILPGHVLDILPLGRPITEQKESRWHGALVRAYGKAISWILIHKGKFLGLLVSFIILTVVIARFNLKLILFPPGLIDQVFIQIDMPRGASLTETGKALQEMEKIVLKLPKEYLETVTSSIGMKGYEETVRLGSHYAQTRVFFTPEETRKRKTKDIVAELREKTATIKGPEKIVFDEIRPGPPVGKAVLVRVRGKDPGILETIAEEVKTELRQIAGIRDIQDSSEGGRDQIRVVINDREAAFAGLNVSRIAQNVFLAIDGGKVTKIHRPDEEVDVKVRLNSKARSQPEKLLGLNISNQHGRQIQLGQIAHLEQKLGPPFLARYNFKPVVTVTADVDLAKITSKEANTLLQKKFRNIPKRYPGYELIYGGEEEQTEKSLRSLFKAFITAILLDFVILAALFRSYTQPFIILTTIPIGLVGVVYALLLHGAPASFMALLGVVAMTGVVVNNAIVLVNFINVKREQGLPLKDAIVQAGMERLRPIWASSITTLLGLFPTAYGFGGYEPFVAPMALALAWGLTIAMPMTLFLIPATYAFVEDIKGFFTHLFRKRK